MKHFLQLCSARAEHSGESAVAQSPPLAGIWRKKAILHNKPDARQLKWQRWWWRLLNYWWRGFQHYGGLDDVGGRDSGGWVGAGTWRNSKCQQYPQLPDMASHVHISLN